MYLPIYIHEWLNTVIEKFGETNWITLKNVNNNFFWDNILKTLEVIHSISSNFTINKSELFDEIMVIRNCFVDIEMQQKIKDMKSFEEIWLCMYFNLRRLKLICQIWRKL